MANYLEEKLREAACVGDIEAIESLISHSTNVNSKNALNGWTALHWASKRGNEEAVRLLINNGADPTVENYKAETPADVCSNPSLYTLLGEPSKSSTIASTHTNDEGGKQQAFLPNYLNNPPLNGQVDLSTTRLVRSSARHPDLASLPTTSLPAQTDDLIFKVRIAGSADPDYIEIEVPRWKLTYSSLMRICCEELEIKEDQVERIRKLPNVRLRKDSDVKRLINYQCLEVALKAPREKFNNGYQSISVCKDQTILY